MSEERFYPTIPAEPQVSEWPRRNLTYDYPVVDHPSFSPTPKAEDSHHRWSSLAVIAAAVGGGIVGAVLTAALVAWAFGLPVTSKAVQPQSPNAAASPASRVTIQTSQATDAVVAAANKVLPSVVNVTIEQNVQNPFTGNVQHQRTGNGSGVILRSDGYILTNNHVVESADRVLVQIGTKDIPARVVGRDPLTDLAVVKVERTGLPAAEIGDSSKLQVGELAIAVGSPFGLEKTVTSGIVSALGRSDIVENSTSLTTYTNLIQTDASINPGNSGGALVNSQGQVVGINTLIESPSGSSAGIGFAIPIDSARGIADQLIKSGHAEHPFLGVSMASVDKQLVSDLPVESAVLVQGLIGGSPAEKAGIKRGDLILKIGDRTIAKYEDALTAIRSHRVGETVSVEIYRNGKRLTLQATLRSDAQSGQ